jgi:AcrR family transcriptional regulator
VGTHVNIDDQVRLMKKGKRRPYRLQRRAASQAETHLAVARAAFELHSTIGPSRTTVSAIAEKAGVQRLTVYRHFPDQEAIFVACSAYSFAEDPPPDPEGWRSITEPDKRLRAALLQIYGYYRRKRQLLTNLHRDAEIAVVAAALARRRKVLAKGAVLLAEGLPRRDARADRLRGASISHALDFTTWRSLAETQGLSDQELVEVMLSLIASVRSLPAAPRER